jgi:hypothetical protein
MANLTNITYGPYSFRDQCGPIPFLTITKAYLRSQDGLKIGSKYNITLDGTLTPLPSGAGGYQSLDYMQDALMSGFSSDGLNLLVSCNSVTLLSEYPKINSIRLDKSNDNWVYTTPFSIEMEWEGDSLTGNIFVEDITENWSVEFNEDTSKYNWDLQGTGDTNSILVNLTHNVSAKGLAHYTNTGLLKQPYELAKDFVITRLGYDSTMLAQVNTLNLDSSSFTPYNHMRVVQVDEAGGTYGVTESWVASTSSGTGMCNRAIEDFTATVSYDVEAGLTSIDINGNIKGFETRSYGVASGSFVITQTKWEAASGYWDCVRPKLLGRAKFVAGGTVNPMELTRTVGHNPNNGVINYGYKYDTRPCNFITGAISERIIVSDTYPTDVFSSIVIPGRGGGPILQDLNTITEHKRNVSIDVLMAHPSGCDSFAASLASAPTSQVANLLCALETQIASLGVVKFKSSDSDTFDVKTGKYNRNVEWTFSYCTGTPPSTSFC